jgi:hypothetical protein
MVKPERQRLRELLRVVMATAPTEIDCDQLLARVGALLEAVEAGAGMPPDLLMALQHLEVCAECKEEFDALLETHE